MRLAFLLLCFAFPVAASAQVVVTVATDRATYAPTDPVEFSLTATNPTAVAVTLQLSGQAVGFTLNGAEASYCRCAFVTMGSDLTLGPGESVTWGGPSGTPGGRSCYTYTVNDRCPALAPGTYTVRGTLYGSEREPRTYGSAETPMTVLGPLAGAADPDAAGYSLRVAGPNPVRGTATFILRTPEAVALDVLDALGRVVQTVRAGASTGETRVALDVSGFPVGAYVVRVAGREGVAARFVVAR